MKKVGYVLAVLLEAAFLIGAYIVNYFTRRKMGMARYVIYKNQGWERDYPMELLKNGAMLAVAVCTVIVFLLFLKWRKECTRFLALMVLTTVALSAVYLGYTLISSTETMRAYYFISLMMGIAAVIQIIKTGVAVLTRRGKTDGKEKEQ